MHYCSWLLELGPSVDDGVTKLRAVLAAQHATCPNQQFVIVGYSQGAWAAGEALAEIGILDPTLLSQVAAVVLLGDPKLWWRNPDFEGIATKFPPGWGPREPFYMPGMTSPSQPGVFQFRSYCAGQDPFCNAIRLHPNPFEDPEGALEWAGWLWDCLHEDSRNPVHCQHMMYDKGALPDVVANWFVERLNKNPRPATLPAAPSDISVFMTSGGTGIGVSWKSNSNNEDGFDIFNGVQHWQVGRQTFLSSDYGLKRDQTGRLLSGQYVCFQVSAYNAAGISPPTPWGCITVP